MTENAVVLPEAKTILYSVTDETIKRFEGYLDFRVTNIHDKAQLKELHDKRMELVRARTGIDKVRKQWNEDWQKIIKENNATADALKKRMEPIEKKLTDYEEEVERQIAEHKAAERKKVIDARKKRLAEIGWLDDVSESVVSELSEAAFEDYLTERLAIVAQRKIEEQARLEREERARREAEEQAERERQAEALRIAQEEADRQAREEAEREARERLQAEEARQAEERRKLAEERAEIERVKAELAAAEERIRASKATLWEEDKPAVEIPANPQIMFRDSSVIEYVATIADGKLAFVKKDEDSPESSHDVNQAFESEEVIQTFTVSDNFQTSDPPEEVVQAVSESSSGCVNEPYNVEKMIALWEVVTDYIHDQKIRCPETITQCDWVIESACEFIFDCCNIVGYMEFGDDE